MAGRIKKDGDYDTADEVSSAILEIPGVESIGYAPYNGYGGDDVDVMVILDEGTDIQTVIDAIDYDDVVDLEDNGDRTYTFTVITGYKLDKSKPRKGEEKIPVSEDDTVEIEEMDGKRYVEIEPKDEHAEEVATGYEKEGDDLNTEENITHPDTSKPKKSKTEKSAPPMMSVHDAIRTCAEYQWANKRNGLMPDEIYELTGNRPENFMSGMVARGRVAKMKCADGIMYRFKM